MIRIAIALIFGGALLVFGQGCVQVNLANDRGRVERVHQDVARTTSSTQSTDLTADVPVSLIPK